MTTQYFTGLSKVMYENVYNVFFIPPGGRGYFGVKRIGMTIGNPGKLS